MTKKSPSSDDIHSALNSFGNREKFADPLNAVRTEDERSIESNGSDFYNDIEDDEESTICKSTSNSYKDEWIRLFECKNFESYIKREGMKGRLRNSRFRSICWRVFLKCLSTNVSNWSAEICASRKKYDDLLHRVLTSPESDLKDKSLDVSLNNPLCQSEDSPWQRFFQDKRNKQDIQQDVTRCFPEIAFFQKQQVQDMLLNILFCYAKENPETSYKQGMHEVVAPLIFVLHSDQQAYLHSKEMESSLIVGADTRPLVGELLDPDYLEHDSYTMFAQLMETMKPWYQYGKRDSRTSKKKELHSTPFSNKEDRLGPATPIVNKIQRIHDVILQKNDFELYTHLTRLDIHPQIYGIRWVRLLFGREFTLQDLLVLWDAFFADSASLDLIDYFFVAMLMLVRELLLPADNNECLNILMHFPMSGDVHFLINKALHLRDPLKHSRPANYQFQIFHQSRTGNYMAHTIPRSQSKKTPSIQPSNSIKNRTNAMVTSGVNSLKRMTKTTGVKAATEEQPSRMVKSSTYGDMPHPLSQSSDEKVVVTNKPLPKKNAISSPTHSINSEPRTSRVESFFTKPRSNSKKHNDKEESEAQKELLILRGRMNDTQNMCRYCATKMEAHILQIQDALESHRLPEDDSLLMSLAGLKQVKDILSGTLKFAQGVLEEDEINISDNYFSEESETNTSVKHFDSSRETFLQGDDWPKTEESHEKNNGHVSDTLEDDPSGVN
ncbi:TBC1 domain family member 5 [Holothuria leucospilota]|uniref:TBC1 domain family member 5 n=1 Tax=Holothuria leucospilota TaxID=206669 RepID=A0A9Q1C1M0_HOLLE|nr:TBC1 domain family member 5 [Holothuria leucospilota]